MAGIRVLIVDDVERVRQELQTFLTLAGNIEVVAEARNGLEAIRLADALCPQVILMDLEMPVLDGYEAARQINARHPTCRILALTIHAGAEERRAAQEAGMKKVIPKGVPLEELLRAIRDPTTDEDEQS